eukprot:1161213-Pelagomonas_calceolata.AAC.2
MLQVHHGPETPVSCFCSGLGMCMLGCTYERAISAFRAISVRPCATRDASDPQNRHGQICRCSTPVILLPFEEVAPPQHIKREREREKELKKSGTIIEGNALDGQQQ